MINVNGKIAVIIPCYNEEAAIAKVVQDFRLALPSATIYVYDNNSKDRTSEVARAAGAVVRFEPLKGKGNVVRRMFADVDADYYIMVDGDATYDASVAPQLLEKLITENLDMVNGARVTEIKAAYRAGHVLGNKLLTGLVAGIFGKRFKDMLSGYRVFSRRFVKSFPAISAGFEIETELTVHALQLRLPVGEVDTTYVDRPPGSVSKLNTYRDGIRILWMIAHFVKRELPLHFFSLGAALMVLLALVLGGPVILEYVETGLVPRLPTAVLSASLVILAAISLACGLILNTVTLGRIEAKRLTYLSLQAPQR
ncbi:MAG: glycosyltransferase family 2 protein [Bdellovibrionales bacterium]